MMASGEYYHCDVCGAKTFYDADIDWEVENVGSMKVICDACAQTHYIVIMGGRDNKRD